LSETFVGAPDAMDDTQVESLEEFGAPAAVR